MPTPTPTPTAVPAQPRVPAGGAGKGTGTGTRGGKPFGDLISRTAPPGGKGGLMDDAYRNMLDMFSTELTKETAENFAELQKTANDFSKIETVLRI